MAGYFVAKRQERERTRQEVVASGLPSGQLVDYLQQYLNSAGTAGSLYARSADVTALEVIEENLSSIQILCAELKGRRKDSYVPAPSPRLDSLVAEFSRRQKASDPSPGPTSPPVSRPSG